MIKVIYFKKVQCKQVLMCYIFIKLLISKVVQQNTPRFVSKTAILNNQKKFSLGGLVLVFD